MHADGLTEEFSFVKWYFVSDPSKKSKSGKIYILCVFLKLAQKLVSQRYICFLGVGLCRGYTCLRQVSGSSGEHKKNVINVASLRGMPEM